MTGAAGNAAGGAGARAGARGGAGGAADVGAPPDLLVGLDLGTSGLKGVVVGAGGEVAARAHAAYATDRSEPGMAEQDPEAWLRALRRVVRALAGETAPERWAAIGLSAMIPTLVVVDGRGRPVGPAVTWEDARAGAEGEELARALGRDELFARTGQHLDGRYLLPMWLHRRRAARGGAPSSARPLAAKDFLFAHLTGEYSTDPSTATGFGCYDLRSGGWLADAAARAAVPDSGGLPVLPSVLPATGARPLTASAAAHLRLPAGIPVCVGAADSVCAALALGCREPGDIAYMTGSSTVVLGVSAEPHTAVGAPYLVTPLATPGWGLEMDLVSTGSAVAWLARLLGLGRGGEAKVMEIAAAAEPGARGARLLPFLGHGEQGALWDPSLQGTALGLGLEHGPADLARALVEAIVLETRRCVEALTAVGLPRGPLRAGGHGAATPFFRQLLADALDREVAWQPDDEAASARGAAAVAGASLGRGAAPVTPVGADVTRPDPAQRTWWDRRWDEHARDVKAVQQLYRT